MRYAGYLVVLCALIAGCGGETQPPGPDPAAQSGKQPPASGTTPTNASQPPQPQGPPPLQMVLTSGLPPTNEIPDLDGGRLDGAVPEDWILARTAETLLQCRRRADADYPTLMITAKPEAGIANVNKDNVRQFAEAVAAEVAGDASLAQTPLKQPVTPVKIGDFYGVEYSHGAKTSTQRLHRYFLITVAGSRRYIVELRALEGTQDGYIPAAQAVAAKLKFKPAE